MLKEINGAFTVLDGERFYKIENYDLMDDFFMTITSSSDVWNFLWSKGGITAGRMNADHAIFQYGTADKISDYKYTTGSYTAVAIETADGVKVWEPFGKFLCATGVSTASEAGVQYNLYKNVNGSKVVFEEVNENLRLTFRYGWTSSKKFGLVKFCKIINLSDKAQKVKVLDGARNIMPAIIASSLQNDMSVLVNAYKQSDLDKETSLAMFALSSALTDRAEPNEALLANTCWFTTNDDVYLSDNVIKSFFAGEELAKADVLKGGRGNCFILHETELAPKAEDSWSSVFDHSQTIVNIVALKKILADKTNATKLLAEDIEATDKELDKFIGEADGIQNTADEMACVHHRTNVIFNIMRGGFFSNDGKINIADFLAFIKVRSTADYEVALKLFSNEELKETVSRSALCDKIFKNGNKQLTRLFFEYMPVIFSRRHGDPSRPWNKFNIALTDKNGNQVLNYEGNWRDIFQNWEALLVSYPEYIPHVLAKFVNAMTIDGFNPYRISREGIDWECPDPTDPWAQFGYWGDHQVIYLQKILELLSKLNPADLDKYLGESMFSTSNVPYRLKSYADICKDPRNSLVFDKALSDELLKNAKAKGNDQKLVLDKDGKVALVSLSSKLLQIIIAKAANIVPAGGMWMNTQRPEWNDANNALAGWGLSVVTLCYMERMLKFLIPVYEKNASANYELPVQVAQCMKSLKALYAELNDSVFTDNAKRKEFTDKAGLIFEKERNCLYANAFNAGTETVTGAEIKEFYTLTEKLVSESIRRNKRANGLYNTYNTLKLNDNSMEIELLQEMLEGQVAVLSSNLLDSKETVEILTALQNSGMYEERQNSFMLYPNKTLPTFMEKNLICAEKAQGLEAYLEKDADGFYHFNDKCQNEEKMTDWLAGKDISEADKAKLFALYEKVFNHHAFTGRSGTFYAYEGLGSIYWHMVAKLLVAVQEAAMKSLDNNDGYGDKLKELYQAVKNGLGGSAKKPEIYGAFPFDPYSHTPYKKGACQPGMTGQVKEEILTRWGELGVSIESGCAVFNPRLLSADEMGENGLEFTWCGVPVVYKKGNKKLEVTLADGSVKTFDNGTLPQEVSTMLFARNNSITNISYTFH